jgi:hypothetical protein
MHNGYFTWKPTHIYHHHISLNSSYNTKCFRQKKYKNQNPRLRFNNFYLKNPIIYEIMWKNIVERGRPQMTIYSMRIACWIPKATNTYSGCVILIAFPQQQCFHESVSILHYTYNACLVMN